MAVNAGQNVYDRNRESIMILLTMGLNFDCFLDQPFRTQILFQNDQVSLPNSSPRRHTIFCLRAAALL